MSRATLARKSEATATGPALKTSDPSPVAERPTTRSTDAVVAGGVVQPRWSLSDISIFPPLQSRSIRSGAPETAGGEELKKPRTWQRQDPGTATPSGAPNVVGAVLRSQGLPLDAATRGFMEPRFRHDFGRVRVHADEQAANSARAVNALAYTVGNDLVFGQGQYAPDTRPGRRLLAHELAHTVQQSLSGTAPIAVGNLPISEPEDGSERQADAAAEQVARPGCEPAGGATSPPTLSPTQGMLLHRQTAAPASGPAEAELSRQIHEAATQAAQKAHEKGLDKLPDHIPASPQQRREPETPRPPSSAQHLPSGNLRPDPRDRAAAVQPDSAVPEKPTETGPAAPQAAANAQKPDPGSREVQIAPGIAAESGPAQAGVALQGALQDKNWVPGKVVDFLHYFHLQLGVLQPTLTLQLTHLQPVQPSPGTAAAPLPPPDTAQLGGTIAPAALKVGDLTITPQIGLAAALAGDVFGKTKGPGQSGTHGQALGVINLQIDYKLSEHVSLTAAGGYQRGLDVGPQGKQDVENLTGSVLATFHF